MSMSVWSHPLYRWYNTHSIYDISSIQYMAQYALYTTPQPQFMTSQLSTHAIKAIISHLTPIIYDSTSTVSLSSHPDYRSYNPHFMYETQPQYIWHHMNYIWHHIHSLCYHTTQWHHTNCIHGITPRTPVIASTVAGPFLIVYWLYHTYNKSDMKPSIDMRSQESYNGSHSLFMT